MNKTSALTPRNSAAHMRRYFPIHVQAVDDSFKWKLTENLLKPLRNQQRRKSSTPFKGKLVSPTHSHEPAATPFSGSSPGIALKIEKSPLKPKHKGKFSCTKARFSHLRTVVDNRLIPLPIVSIRRTRQSLWPTKPVLA